MDDELAVRRLEEARLAALEIHDVEAVGRLMADDLVHIHATGRVQSKPEFIEDLKTLPRRTKRLSLRVRLYGDVAVLTGDIVNTLTRAGSSAPETIPMRITQVARKDDAGCWKFSSFHACRY